MPKKRVREWRYTHEGVELFSVTEVLKHASLSDSYGHIPTHILEAACERGTAIHTVMEELCVGNEVDPFDLKEEWLGYYEAGVKWVETVKPEPIEMETFLWCEKHRIGGRMDFFGLIGDKYAVIDFKTRKPKPEDAIQTAGYRYLLEKYFRRKGMNDLAAATAGAERYVVSLSKDGKVKSKRFDGESDEAIFLAAADIVWWRWENGRLRDGG